MITVIWHSHTHSVFFTNAVIMTAANEEPERVVGRSFRIESRSTTNSKTRKNDDVCERKNEGTKERRNEGTRRTRKAKAKAAKSGRRGTAAAAAAAAAAATSPSSGRRRRQQHWNVNGAPTSERMNTCSSLSLSLSLLLDTTYQRTYEGGRV